MTRETWNWKHVRRPGRVCVARVLTLMPVVKKQLPPGFTWPEHHELHVAIKEVGERDAVLGYVLSAAGKIVRVEASSPKVEAKLRAEAFSTSRPLGDRHHNGLHGADYWRGVRGE